MTAEKIFQLKIWRSADSKMRWNRAGELWYDLQLSTAQQHFFGLNLHNLYSVITKKNFIENSTQKALLVGGGGENR